jgi:cytochrome c
MDSWEWTKVAGAVLSALLVMLLPSTLVELAGESDGHGATTVGYTLPMPEEAKVAAKPAAKAGETKVAAAATAAPAAGAPAAPTATDATPAATTAAAPAGAAVASGIFAQVQPLLAAANAEAGAGVFRACAACHTVDKGGANRVGPNMWGIVNRTKAAVEGFQYSTTLKGMGGQWTYENLAGFINNPKAYAPGTKMVYGGLADPQRLADLLAYLGTLSDAPVPLPKS